MLTRAVRLARAARSTLRGNGGTRYVLAEHPACQGYGHPYYSVGLEHHLDMFSMPAWLQLIADIGLQPVWTDQCRSGASTRKATCFMGTRELIQSLRVTLGTLRCDHAPHSDTALTAGRDAAGAFRTKATARYPVLLCERLARCMLLASAAAPSADARVVVDLNIGKNQFLLKLKMVKYEILV